MATYRNDGFIVIQNDRVELSDVSVLSGVRALSGTHVVPVNELPGVFYRLTAGEYATLTQEQRAAIEARAMQLFGKPVPERRPGRETGE